MFFPSKIFVATKVNEIAYKLKFPAHPVVPREHTARSRPPRSRPSGERRTALALFLRQELSPRHRALPHSKAQCTVAAGHLLATCSASVRKRKYFEGKVRTILAGRGRRGLRKRKEVRVGGEGGSENQSVRVELCV